MLYHCSCIVTIGWRGDPALVGSSVCSVSVHCCWVLTMQLLLTPGDDAVGLGGQGADANAAGARAGAAA